MRKALLFLSSVLLAVTAHSQTVTVLIDPGHGGTDPGHESVNKEHMPEKDLNLIIAKKFGGYLEEKLSNVKVLYTRTDDTYPSLDSRVEMANSKNVDYFISIHCNGSPNTSIHGTESHVHSMSSKKSVKLAKEFEKEFGGKAGRKSRGVKDSDDREHTLQVLKFTEMTSVLVECGFLTNVAEANYLNTEYGQDILASALFRGLRSFLKAEHPTISFTGTEAAPPKTNSTTASSGTTTNSSYTVQIMSSQEALETTLPAFKKLDKPVVREQIAETGYKYRYTVGTFATKEAAETYKNEVRKKGFPDAIVVQKKKT
jgi:N-acetylmuramoyl-L-alanine amidase